MFLDPNEVIWVVAASFVVAFFLSFGVGANDVANSFGTSVGAKVLTLKQACLMATVFEVAGACLVGYKVSDTVRKGIFDIAIYEDNEKTLMLGNLAALSSSAVWNIIATIFRLPVSGTHSIVGAVIGFSLVARGFRGLNFGGLAQIVTAWIVSPLLSALVSASIFHGLRQHIIFRKDAIDRGLLLLPFLYGTTLFVNVFSLILDGPPVLGLHVIPVWGAYLISLVVSLLVAAIVWKWYVPRLRLLVQPKENELQTELPVIETKLETPLVVDSGAAKGPLTGVSTASAVANALPQSVASKRATNLAVSFDKTAQLSMFDATESPASSPQLVSKAVLNGEVGHRLFSATKGLGASSADIAIVGSREHLSLEPHAYHRGNSSKSELLNRLHKMPIPPEQMRSMESILFGKPPPTEEKPEVARLFSYLQILTAAFGSFAHGGNDVANAVGPLVAVWLIYKDGTVQQTTPTPFWVLFYGGVGIAAGLWMWGKRVIQSIGGDLTKVTPTNGFSIEIGAACTVLLASKFGVPISTTHCKVGSIVAVGCTRNRQSVDWILFRGIVAAWLLTLPVTCAISATVMAVLLKAAG